VLEPLLAGFVGRRLDLRGLNEAASVLTRHYQRNGHLLSYAYLPAQRVDGGVIELAVLEGRIESVQVVTAQDVRLTDRVVQAHTDRLVSRGETPEPVLQAAVERQVLLLNDIPGVTARAAFTPGSSTGGAELVVSVAEDEALVTRLEYNNHGGSSTGPHRAGLTLQFRDLFGVGDNTVARGIVSNRGGLVTGSLSTQVPVGGDGWRFGASLSRLQYQLGDSFAELGAVGRADTLGLEASYPLRRSVDSNIWLRAGFDLKQLKDDLLALGTGTRKRSTSGDLGLSIDLRDGFGGVNAFSGSSTFGQLRRTDQPTREWRKVNLQAAGAGPGRQHAAVPARLYQTSTTGSTAPRSWAWPAPARCAATPGRALGRPGPPRHARAAPGHRPARRQRRGLAVPRPRQRQHRPRLGTARQRRHAQRHRPGPAVERQRGRHRRGADGVAGLARQPRAHGRPLRPAAALYLQLLLTP
jgi:hypothetical protein